MISFTKIFRGFSPVINIAAAAILVYILASKPKSVTGAVLI